MVSILEICENDWHKKKNIPPKLMNDYELALKKTPARYMYVCVVKGKDNKNTRERDISRKNRHSERSNPHANNQKMHPKESRKK